MSSYNDKISVQPSPRQFPPDVLTPLAAPALWDALKLHGTVASIQNALGLSESNWRSDLLPILQGVSEFVQQFPASASHHHAQPGGLLIHLFEVAEYAVKLTEGRELPPGRSPEERAKYRHHWRCGTVIAALLHDIGKPISDLRIELVSLEPKGTPKPWNPLAASLIDMPDLGYRVKFTPSSLTAP